MIRFLTVLACWAVAAAALGAAVPTLMDWLENPSGIFHSPAGTNWQFVFDTWWSWFWPLVQPMLGLALGLGVAQSLLRKHREKSNA